MARSHVLLDDETFRLVTIPAWERSFSIRFAPDDFGCALTVGDIWAVVAKRMIGDELLAQNACCASQRTFYRLRRALTILGRTRADISPSSSLSSLFPLRTRQRQWNKFHQESNLPLPALRIPVASFALLWAGATLGTWGIAPSWSMAVISGLAVALIVSDYSPLRVALPVATMGNLTTALVSKHYALLIHPSMRHNRMELRDLVLAGLANCSIEHEEIASDDLSDGTVLGW